MRQPRDRRGAGVFYLMPSIQREIQLLTVGATPQGKLIGGIDPVEPSIGSESLPHPSGSLAGNVFGMTLLCKNSIYRCGQSRGVFGRH